MTNSILNPFRARGTTLSRTPSAVKICKQCGILTGPGTNHTCASPPPERPEKPKQRLTKPILVSLSAVIFIATALWYCNAKPQPILSTPTVRAAATAGNLQSSGTSPSPTLEGQWQMQVYTGKDLFPSFVQLKQDGPYLSGCGRDNSGDFVMTGRITLPNQVSLVKRYSNDARRRGAHPVDIVFEGTIRNTSPERYSVEGKYQTQLKSGFTHSYYRKSRWVTLQGIWSAQRSSPVVDTALMPAQNDNSFAFNPLRSLDAQPRGNGSTSMPSTPSMNSMPSMHSMPAMHSAASQTTALLGAPQVFVTTVGGVVILFGIGLAFVAIKLFGPDGITSSSEVARYIPSQLRGEHDKMLNTFGKAVERGGVELGSRSDWRWWSFWKPKRIAIPAAVRKENPHMLVIGSSGKGKTRLISSMVSRDIESEDRAVVIIDTCGELTRLVSKLLKVARQKHNNRLVIVDPCKNLSPSYNPLEMTPDGDLQAAASAVVRGFKSLYVEKPGTQSKWNHQTANILRNAALLLMINGRTMTDLPALLQDNDFRDLMLEKLETLKSQRSEYITIAETWNQYKRLGRSDQWIEWVEPILNQVNPMLSDTRLRSIISTPISDLNLKEIILQKKIVIVRIPKGELGQNANLLGSLLVTGLQQAALNLLKDSSAPKDRQCALYIDELDLLADKETITALCSETNRYQIGFVAALKTMQHIPEDFRHKMLISVGTIAAFSLVRKDGELIGPQMFRVDGRKFKHQSLQMYTQRLNIPNASNVFHLITDEEKLNIDRVVAQETQHFFCYRVGTVAGVFKMRAPNFKQS